MLKMPSKEVNKLVREIIGLAVEVTNRTKHDVFVNYAGHVNSIDILYCFEGYDNRPETVDIERGIYLEREDAKARLLNVKGRLLELLNN